MLVQVSAKYSRFVNLCAGFAFSTRPELQREGCVRTPHGIGTGAAARQGMGKPRRYWGQRAKAELAHRERLNTPRRSYPAFRSAWHQPDQGG